MKLIHNVIPGTWGYKIDEQLAEGTFETIGKTIHDIRQTDTVYPSREDLFKAFRLCSFEDTKVILLGQDPYPSKGHAHGLSFGTLASEPPPSLVRIAQEIESSVYDGFMVDFDYTLESWAEQGVLLLNTALTVKAGVPNSHKHIWKPFTEGVVRALNTKNNVIWILLGNFAKEYKEYLSVTHFILEAGHPSPLNTSIPFLGSGVFKKTNDRLEFLGLPPIKW